MVTECLRRDHETIRSTCAELEESVGTAKREVRVLHDHYGELTGILHGHQRREEAVLSSCRNSLDDDVQELAASTHERQQRHLEATGAQVELARESVETAAVQLADLIQEIDRDMRKEEAAVFPTVEHVAGPGLPGGRQRPVAPAINGAGVRGHRPWWTVSILSLGAAAAVFLIRAPAADDHRPPALLDFLQLRASAEAPIPSSARRRFIIAQHVMIQSHGRLMAFGRFAQEAVERITGTGTWSTEEATQIVLSIMAEPLQWEDREIIRVSSEPLRGMLLMDPAAMFISSLHLRASNVFLRAIPEILKKQRRHVSLTSLERETLLVHERFLILQALLEQEVYLVPPASEEATPQWLPILRPDGYPSDIQRVIKRMWSTLLGAVRQGESSRVMEASQQLSNLLQRLEAIRTRPVASQVVPGSFH